MHLLGSTDKFYLIESNMKEREVNHTSSASINGNNTSSSFLTSVSLSHWDFGLFKYLSIHLDKSELPACKYGNAEEY